MLIVKSKIHKQQLLIFIIFISLPIVSKQIFMPKQKPITITFIVSGGKGQSIETYPSQKLYELKLKVAKKIVLAKDKVVILTYKNKDLFEDQQTLNNLQINDKSILYIRVVQKINLQTSHKLGETKMKKSLNMESQDSKKQDKNQQVLQKNQKSSKQLVRNLIQQQQSQKFQKNNNQINTFSIFLQVQGKRFNIDVTFLTKVFQLKTIIQKKAKLNIQNKIFLKLNNVNLDDNKLIGDYQINEYQVINCIINQQQAKQELIKNQQKSKNIGSSKQNQNYFKSFQEAETKQIIGGEQWFQKRKNQNHFLNKFQGFMNCDLKKSQIIDDQCEQITQQQNQQYKCPRTPQYTHNSKNFSTPYTPSIDLNFHNKNNSFSLFQRNQATSKIWNGEIIQTESVAYIEQNQSMFLQNEFKTCLLYCTDNNRKQYCFECNKQVKLEDIRNILSKVQKTKPKNINILLQEDVLDQMNQQTLQNFSVIDYWAVSNIKQLKWVYKIQKNQKV